MKYDRLRREKRDYASELRMSSAVNDPPPDAVKRLLKRLPGELPDEAMARAELKGWWPWVIDPTPRGEDPKYWVWFCDAAVTQAIT